jgi:hypothetical protein
LQVGESVATSRATTVVLLTIGSLLLLSLVALQWLLSATAVALGILLIIPYAAGAKCDQALFQPL